MSINQLVEEQQQQFYAIKFVSSLRKRHPLSEQL